MARGQWVYTGGRAGKKPSHQDKMVVTVACERLITDVLLPRYLPMIRPTEFNYPIAIYGKWHGNSYRFITRYRSHRDNAVEPEFEAPFARIEFVARDRFDLSYYRHTGRWHRLYRAVTLDEALRTIGEGAHFEPH